MHQTQKRERRLAADARRGVRRGGKGGGPANISKVGTVNNEQQTIQINTGMYLLAYRTRRRPLGSLLRTTRGNRFEITALS